MLTPLLPGIARRKALRQPERRHAARLLWELRRHHRGSAAHSLRVARMAAWIGGEGLYMPALMHDIGKLMVPARVLAAPRLLDPFEVACVRGHPGWAEPVMRQEWGRRPPTLYVDVALQHHERCNGSGYPRRLHGYQIRDEARAVAVCDVFDARTTRTDRRAMALEAAIGWLARRVPLYVDAGYVHALAARLGLSAGAAGAASDNTANLAQFTLKLPPERLPVDTSGALTVTYAGKHQLTQAGTSIPERHHDIVLLGAAAYAMLSYQAGTNDLFEYQDGEMRDRVDERGVPAAWLTAGTSLLTRFQGKLTDIKGQRNAGVAAVARWGDVPARWRWT